MPQQNISNALRLAFNESRFWESLRLLVGAKEHVPNREDGREVPIIVLLPDGVVKPMVLRRDDEPRKAGKANMQIGVLESSHKPVDARHGEDHNAVCMDNQSQRDKEHGLQNAIQPERAIGGCGVHARVGVMEGVHLPKPRHAMFQAVKEVVRKVVQRKQSEQGQRKVASGEVQMRRWQVAGCPQDGRGDHGSKALRDSDLQAAGKQVEASAFESLALNARHKSNRRTSAYEVAKHGAFSLALLLCAPLTLLGQSCTSSTCTAVSPSEADVLAALPAPSNSNSIVTVTIPAGTANWTTGFSYTIPAAVNSLTIQGATSVSCTGTAGTSSYVCTATDSTNIVDMYTSNNPLMTFTVGASNTSFRITGLTVKGGNLGGTYSKYNGTLEILSGNSQSVRLDHNHFNANTYSPAQAMLPLRFFAPIAGVADHNLFEGQMQAISDYGAYNDAYGNGDGTWANPTPWGQIAGVFYVESNYINGNAMIDDCGNAGAMVIRYNSLINTTGGVQTHGTKTSAGSERGCRSLEVYKNYFTHNDGVIWDAAVGSKVGPALVWGNTTDNNFYRFMAVSTDRSGGDTSADEVAPPNGWGYCSSSTTVPSSGSPNGVGSQWDGNQPNVATGNPCLDGIGRGKTVQHLNGATFPGRLNSTTGTVAWPQQMLEPVYVFANSVAPRSGVEVDIRDITTQFDRDIYFDCGTYNSACSGGFTGTKGTGSGLLSARPSTCTAGPGGTYYTSPAGSYGVAYWETDNQKLDACTSANVWTTIYQPYAYPHPLVSGGGVSLTVSPVNGSISGTNCSTNASLTSGTTIGPCTFTPNPGYVFTSGWTSSGSASCSGTGGCGPFNITANSTISASAVLASNTLSTSYTGTGSGTITCTPPAGTVSFGTSVSCNIVPDAGSTTTNVTGCGGAWTSSPYTFSMPNSSCTVLATFQGTVATPSFSPGSGSYTSSLTVAMSSTTGAAAIHYTSDGSTPNCSSTLYSSPISVTGNTTLKAIGCAASYTNSAIGSAAYTFACGDPFQFGPNYSGTYTVPPTTLPFTVGFTSPTSGCTMHYTSDGSTPTCSSTAYPGGDFSISAVGTYTYRVIACQTGYTSSNVIGGTWAVENAGSTSTGAVGVQLTGAVIR